MKEKKKDIENFDDFAKPTWHDFLAIMIAQFEILMPMAIIGVIIMGLVLLFFTKVWLHN